MKVLLVTTWNAVCGISEHAFYLKEAIEQADPSIVVTPSQEALDPTHPSLRFDPPSTKPDWIILNYHMALHSRWSPEYIQSVQRQGIKVLVVLHDSGVPNSEQAKALLVADVMIVHEPAEDLPGAVYLRQGVPDWSGFLEFPRFVYKDSWCGPRPIVGSIGFPFPWKNLDLLAEASAEAGWAMLLLAPNATPAQVDRWTRLNPHSLIETRFTDRVTALAMLTGCDATAFLYANANTGTSAAIRLGIATRKPVLASTADACRQFRDLAKDNIGCTAMHWVDDLSVLGVADALEGVTLGCHPGMVRLAHQDRWSLKGEQIARLLRGGTL